MTNSLRRDRDDRAIPRHNFDTVGKFRRVESFAECLLLLVSGSAIGLTTFGLLGGFKQFKAMKIISAAFIEAFVTTLAFAAGMKAA